MQILFYIALGYLVITTAILVLNKNDFRSLTSVPPSYFDRQAPSVSICIPARNEEETIERCVRSALAQNYPHCQVYVLDDESTDGTADILEKVQQEFQDTLTVLPGRTKPDDWLGKPWACHQLAEASDEQIIIFIDADTWLASDAVAKTVRMMGQDVLDFLTLWPIQKLGTFWEKNVIPLIYQTLFTLLPVRYVSRPPRWIPSFFQESASSFFAAACGQFLAFKRSSYEDMGGHESVKDEIVEDVALAKNMKYAGFSMNMYHGKHTVNCRMYRSSSELWSGLRKNFLAGFNYNIPLFVITAILNFIAYLFPPIALPFLIANSSTSLLTLCCISIFFMLLQRFIINRWFGWNTFYGLLHPLGVSWFQLLGLQVLKDYVSERPPEWKGRKL